MTAKELIDKGICESCEKNKADGNDTFCKKCDDETFKLADEVWEELNKGDNNEL